MSGSRVDQATISFRRLLAEAGANERTRVDALVVLSQRTVFAGTWPGQTAVRTLTNRQGETAMPLFTGRDMLEDTANRFGWRGPDGTFSSRELGAREALEHALARGVHFVVIDLGSEHAVEFSREEVEPLLSLPKARGAGAFAAAGEPEAVIRDAVRRSSRPPQLSDLQAHANAPAIPAASSVPHTIPSPVDIDMPFAELKARARGVSQPIAPRAPARALSQPLGATPGSTAPAASAQAQPHAQAKRSPSQSSFPAARSGSQSAMAAVRAPSQPKLAMMTAQGHAAASAGASTALSAAKTHEPKPDTTRQERERESGEQERAPSHAAAKGEVSDAVLAGISSGLRAFPEVEWACVLDADGMPAIGLRVDPSFMERVAEITSAVMHADGVAHGFSVLLLSNPESVQHARKHGRTFYPWKR